MNGVELLNEMQEKNIEKEKEEGTEDVQPEKKGDTVEGIVLLNEIAEQDIKDKEEEERKICKNRFTLMDKNSKVYKRAIELDKRGFLTHLKREFLEMTKEDPDPFGIDMGGVTSTAYEAVLGDTTRPDPGEEDEFEIREVEDPLLPSDLCNDPAIEENEAFAEDVVLEKDKEEVHLAIQKMRDMFPFGKALTFSMHVGQDELKRFQGLINWINQTSNSDYRLSHGKDGTAVITKLPQVLHSRETSVGQEISYSESKYVESEACSVASFGKIPEPQKNQK